ncbi:MAG TPA: YfcE family phosphodiesterase [Candidatus Aminicenantes bacterium]|nr:YfcE family phosphodiesterase [Candidatus Aminicenantes bacterium]
MRVAVISDTHDHTERIARAVRIAAAEGCEWMLHLGDVVAPFAVTPLGEFPGQIQAVFGNNDGETHGLRRAFARIGGEIDPPPYRMELAGKRLAMLHDPWLLEELAASQRFDYILYGHLHEYRQERDRCTLSLNPGDGGGWVGTPQFCLLDLETGRVTPVSLRDA